MIYEITNNPLYTLFNANSLYDIWLIISKKSKTIKYLLIYALLFDTWIIYYAHILNNAEKL